MTPLSEPVDQPMPGWVKRLLGTIALVIVGWVLLTQVILTDDKDRSADVRASAGASSCQQTGYELSNRLDGSKTTVYGCYFPSGRERCVTLENGITRDVTGEVRLLFENTIGADKPTCAD